MTDGWPGQCLHQYAIFDRDDFLTDILQGDEVNNINAPDKFQRTPVYTAVSNNSLRCLSVLLQHGADPSIAAGDRLNKMTPLHQALIDGKTEAIRLLLEYGASMETADNAGLSSYNLAKSINEASFIKLFEEEAEKRRNSTVRAVSELCEACKTGCQQQVEEILAQPGLLDSELANRREEGGTKTPLCYAAEMGDKAIMQLLLNSVASVTQTTPGPVHFAVQGGHLDILKLLLEKDPECCRQVNDQNQTPLHLAAEHGFKELCDTLLSWPYPRHEVEERRCEGTNVVYWLAVDINAEDLYGQTPLNIACQEGQTRVVEFLLQFKVDAKKMGGTESFPYSPVDVNSGTQHCLSVAVEKGYYEIVDLLLEAGACKDIVGREEGEECSALLLAASRRGKSGDLLMVDKLLQSGVADLNNQILKEAVKRQPQFIPHLLKYKASKDQNNCINKKGMKMEFQQSFMTTDNVETLSSTDDRYKQLFPTNPVYVRWQNLKVLSTIERDWLNCVANMYNPTRTNINARIPLFAITKVDVSGNCLTVVPPALLQLPSLCVLNAADNKIEKFPVQEKFSLDCKSLEELDIQRNDLRELPSYLFTQLPALRLLYAGENKICSLPMTLWQATNLKTLDLSHNCLEELPKPGDVWLDPSEHERKITSSTERAGDQTPRAAASDPLPDEAVSNVKHINHWTHELKISDESLKEAEGQRRGLKILKLSRNKFTEFPDFLSCCIPHLETLEVSRNAIRTLGKVQAYPKYLKALNLSHNSLEDMDDWLSDPSLESEQCYCGQASTVGSPSGRHSVMSFQSLHGCGHRRHFKLENLEALDLSFNKLHSIAIVREPPRVEGLDQGSNGSEQRSLVKSTNNIKEMEKAEQEFQGRLLFPNLQSLDLSSNKFASLPDEIGKLKALRSFYLKKNENLKELPAQLGLLSNLSRMEIDLCPIEGPIQDIKKGSTNPTKDIIGFLHSVLEESEQYNSMNLMVVGTWKIGKTSLLKQLSKWGRQTEAATHYIERKGLSGSTNKGEPLSTVGIDINNLSFTGKLGKVEFRTWDFAGQKEYYATHQYFLSPRSLYLVVWNLTEGEPGVVGMRQWLVNIQAQAPSAPVLIVGTHLDQVKAKGKKSSFPANWEESMRALICEKYIVHEPDKSGLPHVMGVMNVSCPAEAKKGTNVDRLKDMIYDLVFELNHPARKHERLLGHKVPKKYILLEKCIKEIVEERKKDNKEPVLEAANYVLTVMNKMEGVGFRNKEDLHQATRFLHENGVLCHFQDPALRDQYFIDPQWLCDQLAQVVSTQTNPNFARSGIMTVASLNHLYLKSDKIGKYILSLLNKFEVALQFDEEHLVLPSLLPTDADLETPTQRGAVYRIPVKRKGMMQSIHQSSDSVISYGFSSFYDHVPPNPGDLALIKCDSSKNPMFSYCRLYLLTYFPSGFWPRLITRILADESFYEPVMGLLQFSPDLTQRCPDLCDKIPTWRCWQTGLELIHFDNVILQIKEVRSGSTLACGQCDYEAVNMKCFFEDAWNDLDVKDSALLEISFTTDCLTFSFGHNEGQMASLDSKCVFLEEKAQARILAKVVEHIDSLLQDWYPELGEARFIQSVQGRYLVTRVIPCPLCLGAVFHQQNSAAEAWAYVSKDGGEESQMLSIGEEVRQPVPQSPDDRRDQHGSVIYSFLVEKCVMNIFAGQNEICEVHGSVSPKLMNSGEGGVSRLLYVAPDLVFSDLDQALVVEDEVLELGKTLGRGAFGKVYAGRLKRGDSTIQEVAVKVLFTSTGGSQERVKRSTQMALEQVCLAYSTARQEVSILQTVQHTAIVPLLGLSKQPLALLLALAPRGSLSDILQNMHKEGLRLPVFVIKAIVVQISDALDYLHTRNIIYRDLKSENVLVWHFPKPNDMDPRQAVSVKLADYGISRSVLPTGARGFGGTPPFIAPEILLHTGKDTYSEKVDIFSFGMFMFELLTCRLPLEGINNPAVHVCHGGRPSLTPEEAAYPSHMLDLMTVCWSQDQENRPTAAQVRMVASCPQFCHLSDAVAMETKAAILSACSVYVEGGFGESEVLYSRDQGDQFQAREATLSSGSEDMTQVWVLSASGPSCNIEIYEYDLNHRCIASRTMTTEETIMGMCVVRGSVWCLDNNGYIHRYSCTSADKDSFSLNIEKVSQVKSMFYHPGDGGHVVMLINESRCRGTSLYLLPEKIGKSSDVPDPIILHKCECVAVISTESGYSIWLGQQGGQIQVRPLSFPDKDAGMLHTHNPPLVDTDCYFIVTAAGNQSSLHSAWTYNYPGSSVYRWDTDKQSVMDTLDCSNLVPVTDSYRIHTSKEAMASSAGYYQVTAIAVVENYLYIGTTWGCITVADALTLKPYSVFRSHSDQHFYIKSILPLGPASQTERQGARKDMTSSGPGNHGIVTIGRGYVDIIHHVTSLERQALIRQEMEDGFEEVVMGSVRSKVQSPCDATRSHTHLLSWFGNQWEYF